MPTDQTKILNARASVRAPLNSSSCAVAVDGALGLVTLSSSFSFTVISIGFSEIVATFVALKIGSGAGKGVGGASSSVTVTVLTVSDAFNTDIPEADVASSSLTATVVIVSVASDTEASGTFSLSGARDASMLPIVVFVFIDA